MRVISQVPSWTETLIANKVNVVGRTRFCIHPQPQVSSIPVVGGTKDIDWEKVRELKPDILLLDKEENRKEVADQAPCEVLVSHVETLHSMPLELEKLAQVFTEQAWAFREMKSRYEQVLAKPAARWSELPVKIPGELQRVCRDFKNYENLVYVIWKDPWMRAGEGTFIHSVLEHLGAGPFLKSPAQGKYPEFEIERMNLEKTYFLFSSEPYPFLKKLKEIGAFQGSVVDGESYSWFGVRALEFLERELTRSLKDC